MAHVITTKTTIWSFAPIARLARLLLAATILAMASCSSTSKSTSTALPGSTSVGPSAEIYSPLPTPGITNTVSVTNAVTGRMSISAVTCKQYGPDFSEIDAHGTVADEQYELAVVVIPVPNYSDAFIRPEIFLYWYQGSRLLLATTATDRTAAVEGQPVHSAVVNDTLPGKGSDSNQFVHVVANIHC
jgi:hypothetical protein